MKLFKKCNDAYQEFLRCRKQLKRKVKQLDISIETDSYTNSFDIHITNKEIYKWINIPIEDWEQVKKTIDELLNKEE